jgi:hypothetical protein
MLLKFALIFGVIYLAVGILGFIPALVHPPADQAPQLLVEAGHGRLLGLFPINIMHNLVHVAIGIWGLASFRSATAALLYARGLAIIYGLLTVLGLIPATSTLFGLAPIHGLDVWLHAATALIAAYFGFMPAMQEKKPGS